jgi:hypothetical protein
MRSRRRFQSRRTGKSRSLRGLGGWPIFASAILTEDAPPLLLLQRWAAMQSVAGGFDLHECTSRPQTGSGTSFAPRCLSTAALGLMLVIEAGLGDAGRDASTAWDCPSDNPTSLSMTAHGTKSWWELLARPLALRGASHFGNWFRFLLRIFLPWFANGYPINR